MENLISAIEAKGFASWNTGGNCRCLVRSNADGSTDVITDMGGLDLPAANSWMLCRYDFDWVADIGSGQPVDTICSGDDSPVDLLTAIDLLGDETCTDHMDDGRGLCRFCRKPL